MNRFHVIVAMLLAAVVGRSFAEQTTPETVGRKPVPVIYSTDLFHPHDDPDDHFDLATLMAIREIEVKALLLDLGDHQKTRPGRIVLEQMFALTGRRVPYATGLVSKLESPTDTGRGQPIADHAAVELLIRTLEDAREPVTVIAAGSLRDVCAAFNREPELLGRKIARLYINIGNADGGDEWNVNLDPHAYVGIMRSGLPIYWCPCQPFGDPRSTFWDFDHAEVLDRAPERLQNFFIYALQVVPPDLIDPIEGLDKDFRPFRHLVWKMHRQMWCTAPFLHAAGLQPLRDARGEFMLHPASQPADAGGAIFNFVPAHVGIDSAARTRILSDAPANMQVFRIADVATYKQAMTRVLAGLLERFPLAPLSP